MSSQDELSITENIKDKKNIEHHKLMELEPVKESLFTIKKINWCVVSIILLLILIIYNMIFSYYYDDSDCDSNEHHNSNNWYNNLCEFFKI